MNFSIEIKDNTFKVVPMKMYLFKQLYFEKCISEPYIDHILQES